MKKFLIVKTSSLGDIIQSFPVLHYLRRKFPDAQIDWVVERNFSELVKCHPYVSHVLYVDTKNWRKSFFNANHLREILSFRRSLKSNEYDAVFDLQSNVKSGFITWQATSRNKVGFARKTVHELPNLLFTNKRYNPPEGVNIREDYLALAKQFLQDPVPFEEQNVLLKIDDEQTKKLDKMMETSKELQVLVCPGSAWRNKQIPLSSLVTLLELVHKDHPSRFLFLWGNEDEKKLAQQLHEHFPHSLVLDKMPLPMLQNLMGRVDLVMAMDSLPLHLAGTTNTPTFSVFGASLASKFKPEGERHFSYQGQCPYGKVFKKRCPILRTCNTGACIRDLHGEELYKAFKSWWNSAILEL